MKCNKDSITNVRYTVFECSNISLRRTSYKMNTSETFAYPNRLLVFSHRKTSMAWKTRRRAPPWDGTLSSVQMNNSFLNYLLRRTNLISIVTFALSDPILTVIMNHIFVVWNWMSDLYLTLGYSSTIRCRYCSFKWIRMSVIMILIQK